MVLGSCLGAPSCWVHPGVAKAALCVLCVSVSLWLTSSSSGDRVPFDCQHRLTHGQDVCVTACPTTGADADVCVCQRVERGGECRRSDPTAIDLALLDMHHGWPNLGHDAIVYGIQNIVCDLTPALRAAGLRVRVLSYDVRRGHQIPEGPARHRIYIGTGGPGHLDPRLNDGGLAGFAGHRRGSGLGTAAVRAVRRDSRRR